MTDEQFIWWLHGFFEIENPMTLNEKQTQTIREHVATRFVSQLPKKPLGVTHRSVPQTPVSGSADSLVMGNKLC